MQVFYQIFEIEEYSVLRDLSDVSLVIDLGANVGFSSAYFLSCFPNARVIAVEPDSQNIAICRVNLEPYKDRATTLHGAAWSERTKLNLNRDGFGDGREWAIQVEKADDGKAGEVQAWDIGSLIDLSGSACVDLLKVDIERAELAVFGETARDWLPRVKNICIELHGSDCEEVFFKSLANFTYDLAHSGELTICRNLRARPTLRSFAGAVNEPL
jgi:FkbM family methyltransferase